MNFRHAIDSPGSLDSDIRTWITRSCGTKRSNGARTEQPQVVHFTDINDIVEPTDIYLGNWDEIE